MVTLNYMKQNLLNIMLFIYSKSDEEHQPAQLTEMMPLKWNTSGMPPLQALFFLETTEWPEW